MATPLPIQALLPQAQQTLARPTQPTQRSIDRAIGWLAPVWSYTGSETTEELQALDLAFHNTVMWFASFLDGLEPRWLVLIGVSGTGKTMLAKRIADYVREYGRALFCRTEGSKHGPQSDRRIYSYAQEGTVFAPWRTLLHNHPLRSLAAKDWFCVVDELKSESGKRVTIDGQEGVQPEPWETRTCGNLFDDMLRKWRIVTMNLTRSQLATFWDVRIASRLMRDNNVIADLSEVSDYGIRREQFEKQQQQNK